MEIPVEEITKTVERGGTSGIGWRGFETGGFILDGGHDFGDGKEKEDFLPSSAASSVNPALTISRYEIPDKWRFVLVIPDVRPGANGDEEATIFKKYTPIPREEVNEVSHQILMKIIPGILKKDLDCFGEGLKRIQTIGFKKIEINLQNQIVRDLLKFFEDNHVKAYGMSSFGPSVIGITNSDSEAKDLKIEAENFLKAVGGHFYICKPNNTGAKIEYLD